jgi:hypothetical protein
LYFNLLNKHIFLICSVFITLLLFLLLFTINFCHPLVTVPNIIEFEVVDEK